METSPSRRQGIDGLSKRPVSTVTRHTAPRHELKTTSLHTAKPQPSEGEVVSHPSLPVAHAHVGARRTPVVHKLFVFPFTQRFDRRVMQLGVVRMLLDFRFWLAVTLPFWGVLIVRLSRIAPAQLSADLRALINAKNFVWIAIIVAALLCLMALSLAIGAICNQAVMAIKIRSIDHRVSRASVLLRNASSNILKTWANWLVNILSLLAIAALASASAYWLSTTTNALVDLARSYLVAADVVFFVFTLSLLLVRKPLQQAMISTTLMPVRSIQLRSWRLVFKNIGLVVAVVAFWALAITLFAAVAGLLLWALFIYLSVPSPPIIKVLLWLGGVLLMAILWWFVSLWQAMYFSSFYHVIVLRLNKDEISDYLVPHEPLQFRLWPIMFALGAMVLTLAVYSAVLFSQYGTISRIGRNIRKSIPTNLTNIVPKIHSR